MKLKHSFLFNEAGEAGNASGGSTLLGGAGAAGGSAGQQGQQQQQQGSASAGAGDEAAKAYDFRSSLDDKGNFKSDWTATLPDDLKQSAGVLGKYPNPLEALRGLANAQKLIGQKSTLKAPAPDAPKEEVEKFNSQIRSVLGVPEKADDYKLTKPEKLPEGLSWDEAKVGDWQKFFHENNIPPAVANKIVAKQTAELAAQVEIGKGKLDEFVKAQEAELRNDWGANYEVNLSKAAQAAKIAGFDLNDNELANNAKFIKAMNTVSQLIKPDALVGSDKASSGLDGPAQAEDIRRNPNNPWHAAYHGKEGPDRQREAAGIMRRLQGVKE